MFRPTLPPPTPRRGAILIVVLALLALFAVIGLAFVFYSDSEALIARTYRQAQGRNGGGPEAFPQDATTNAANDCLGAFLFEPPDTDLTNALRGHTLTAGMFGRVPHAPTGSYPFNATGTGSPTEPYSGVGTFHEDMGTYTAGPLPLGLTGDRALVVNYTAIRFDTATGSNFLVFDPEWTGSPRTVSTAAAGGTFQPPPTLAPDPGMGFPPSRWNAASKYLPKNAPYTYPDLKDFYLASLSPATGQVIVPSFYRPWHFNAANPKVSHRLAPWKPLGAAPAPVDGEENNTDWITPEGRLKVLRPRPIDQMLDADFAGLPGRPLAGLANYSTAAERTALYNRIRDLIAAGTIIGYPPPDAPADPANPAAVTYSGDLQNLPGGVGAQKMDSLLLDTGVAPIAWNGKFIKPLLSLLVTDLDGLLNLNAHGNIKGGGTTHASYHGLGPWEVSLRRVMGAEADLWVQARYGKTAGVPNPPFARRPAFDPANPGRGFTPVLSLAYARGDRLPRYSLLNWDAAGTPGGPAVVLPNFPTTSNPFLTAPAYPNPDAANPFFSDDRDAAAAQKQDRHPALFNPAVWPAPPSSGSTDPFTLPASDLRRLRARYADDLDEYKQMALARPPATGPTTVVGQAQAGPSYRLDPAHPNRLLLTTLSAGLERGGLGANFGTAGPTTTLQLTPGGLHPTNAATTTAYTGPAAGQDFAASGVDGRNARATLGPLDLNRPLADYRQNTAAPLSPANVGNEAQARLDRQNHARAIFARLVVASGGAATVYTEPTTVGGVTYLPGDVVVPAGLTAEQYNALRYLAQIAANIVDLIDNDDISTPFVWCPVNAAGTGNDPLRAIDPATQVAAPWTNNFATPAALKDRVVFGSEKTRLVINEVYAETTNDPTDTITGGNKPMKPAHVRFWVELLNPSGDAYTNNPVKDSPLGDGSVTIWNGAASPFQVLVVRDNKAGGSVADTTLRDPTNVTGDIGIAADVTFDFNVDGVKGAGGRTTVEPNNGQYWTAGSTGFMVLGPPKFDTGGTAAIDEFDLAAAPSPKLIEGDPTAGNPNALGYALGGAPPKEADLINYTGAADGLRRHVVLLRRLVNPYLQANDPALPTFNPLLTPNPFVTVDYMDHVPANDGVRRADTDTMNRTTGPAPASRYAVGKVQPYAGFAAANAPAPATFPASAVLAQTAGTAHKHTFGHHNGKHTGSTSPAQYAAATAGTVQTNGQGGAVAAAGPTGLKNNDTIVAPFDWLVHFDRPLVNPLELLHVQGVKPHEVTQYTLLPPAAGGTVARKWVGNVPWFGVQGPTDPQPGQPVTDPGSGLPAPAAVGSTNAGLYRALDLLRVKPWVYGAAVGGRLHGRVNLNTVQDRRVLLGLLDPQGGNAFTDAEVNALWTTLFGSRTKRLDSTSFRLANGTAVTEVPVPGQSPTFDDLNPSDPNLATLLPLADQPFKPFGAPEFAGAGTVRLPSGIQDTVLRGANVPTASLPFPYNTPAGNTNPRHPYLDTEMLRKLANNTSTVSNAFAVHLTVVWHEVRVDPNTNKPFEVDEGGTAAVAPNAMAGVGGFAGKRAVRYRLGKEAVRETPGDMRQQFFAVVDRSALWVAPGTGLLTTQASAARQPPFSAALDRVVQLPVGSAGSPTHRLFLADGVYSEPGGAPRLTLFADGRPVVLTGNNFPLVVGAGAGAEVVAVQRVVGTVPAADQAGGLDVILTKPHAAGELVSNGVPGNPGPQDGTATLPDGSGATNKFDVLTNSDSRYKAVVPFFQKVK